MINKFKNCRAPSPLTNVLRFSPVLVGSTLGLVLSVFNRLSDSALSSIVLLGSSAVDFSTSSSLVLDVVSLFCSSGVLSFSLSVCDVGASRTTIIDFNYFSYISKKQQKKKSQSCSIIAVI